MYTLTALTLILIGLVLLPKDNSTQKIKKDINFPKDFPRRSFEDIVRNPAHSTALERRLKNPEILSSFEERTKYSERYL